MGTKICKAPGPDGVPNWVLQDFAPVLTGPLASIVNSAVRESLSQTYDKVLMFSPCQRRVPPRS